MRWIIWEPISVLVNFRVFLGKCFKSKGGFLLLPVASAVLNDVRSSYIYFEITMHLRDKIVHIKANEVRGCSNAGFIR